MKKVIFIFIIALCIFGCKSKKNVTTETKSEEIIQQAENTTQTSEPVSQDVNEISPETFIKDNRLVNTVYVSTTSAGIYKNQRCESLYKDKIQKNFPLKLIAVGESVSIGNVTAPMLEVYYPPLDSFVWIFGADVQVTKPVFRFEIDGPEELTYYLSSTKWSTRNIPWEAFQITSFNDNSDYRWYLIESGASSYGYWNTQSFDSIEVHKKFADEAQEDEEYTIETWTFTKFTQNSFECDEKRTYYRIIPTYDTDHEIETGYDALIKVYKEFSPKIPVILHSFEYSNYPLTTGYSQTTDDYYYSEANDEVLHNNLKLLVKYGVPPESFDFSKNPDSEYRNYKDINIDDLYLIEYMSYWYPIMEREQKKLGNLNLTYPKAVALAFNAEMNVEITDNLRLRTSCNLDSEVITTAKAGSLAYIFDVGPVDCIDNTYSNWVKLSFNEGEAVNINGNEILDDFNPDYYKEVPYGWCFGGYLKLLPVDME